MKLLSLFCLALYGCALAPKVDANYRMRVESFSMPIGITVNGTTITVGIQPAWHYRLPAEAPATKGLSK